MQICCVNCQFYLLVLVTTFVFIFPFLRTAVRAVSLVCPVPLFFSLCCAVWFVIEQIKIDRYDISLFGLAGQIDGCNA